MSQAAELQRIGQRQETGSVRLPTSFSWPAPLQVMALVTLSVALFAEPFLRLVEMREGNIYAHVRFAQQIAETHVLYPGHFLYHVLTVVLHGALPVSWLQAHVVITLALRALLAVTLWSLVRRSLRARDGANDALLAIVLPLALMFASAVSFMSWGQGNFYIGYVVPNVYVSQTMVVLQPIALLTFFAVLRVLAAPRSGPSSRDVVAMAVLALLSTLAKPSYAMVLLPAVATLFLLQRQLLVIVPVRRVGAMLLLGRWCKDMKSVAILGLGLLLPVLAAMGWIYVSTHLAYQQLDVTQDTGFRLAPFKVMAYLQGHYVSDRNVAVWLLLKLALSLLFPAAVAIAYFPQVRHDPRFLLAWLQLAFGLIFKYLFAEDPVYTAGNFSWSAQIALFILFVVSALVLLEQSLTGVPSRWHAVAASKAAMLCYLVLLLHVIAGFGMYLYPAVS